MPDLPETPAPQMSLDQFERQMQADVACFFEKWRLSNEDDPANWPMEMGHADWVEQFLCDISNDA